MGAAWPMVRGAADESHSRTDDGPRIGCPECFYVLRGEWVAVLGPKRVSDERDGHRSYLCAGGWCCGLGGWRHDEPPMMRSGSDANAALRCVHRRCSGLAAGSSPGRRSRQGPGDAPTVRDAVSGLDTTEQPGRVPRPRLMSARTTRAGFLHTTAASAGRCSGMRPEICDAGFWRWASSPSAAAGSPASRDGIGRGGARAAGRKNDRSASGKATSDVQCTPR